MDLRQKAGATNTGTNTQTQTRTHTHTHTHVGIQVPRCSAVENVGRRARRGSAVEVLHAASDNDGNPCRRDAHTADVPTWSLAEAASSR